MFSIPHMLVVFVIVLVVFGPQKLPELARSLGKLMAEFRKASSDFRGAFEEEMKDLERQAREAERKKAADAAAKAADAAPVQAATLATLAGTETEAPAVAADGEVMFTATTTSAVFADVPADAFGELIDSRVSEGAKELVVTPVTEAVARGTGGEVVENAPLLSAEPAENAAMSSAIPAPLETVPATEELKVAPDGTLSSAEVATVATQSGDAKNLNGDGSVLTAEHGVDKITRGTGASTSLDGPS
jgi:sec-independent protein translocase protein TatB